MGHLGQKCEIGQNMKNRSKNRIFHFQKIKFGSFDEFYTYIPYAAGKKLISPKTKKLGRFFGQNDRFKAKQRIFVKKTKIRSKNRVFGFFGQKMGSFWS